MKLTLAPLAFGALSIVVGAAACSSAEDGTPCSGTTCADGGTKTSTKQPTSSKTQDASAPQADSGSPQDSGTPVDSGGKDSGKVDASPPTNSELNPYGVAYPIKGLGKAARKGTTPGSVMANLKFSGYPNGDGSKGLQTISLANFFDPQMKQFKILIIAGTANWCGYCKKEIPEIVSAYTQYQAQKIGVLNPVMEATTGQASTQTDLDIWVKAYKHNFTAALDPAGQNLGSYGLSGYPFNVILDARSMEILAVINGSPSEGMLTRAKTYTSWVDKNLATTY